ncbi:MAG: glycosyltransferase family 4 protein [Candidatus Woesearchaeota archaeon]
MRIIRTIESFYPKVHGPANQAFKISSELEKRGISSPIYTTDFDVNKVPDKEKIENVDVKRFHAKKRIFKYIYSPDMKKALNNTDFDIIHSHCYRSYQSDIGFKIAKARTKNCIDYNDSNNNNNNNNNSKMKKPFVISTHGTLLSYKHFVGFPWNIAFELYDILTLKKCVKKADAVVVNSTQEYNEAIKFGVKRERLHLIPVGIDIEDYEMKRSFENNSTLNLLYIGRITRNRPLLPILKAIQLINKNKIDGINDPKSHEETKRKKVNLIIIGSEVRSSFSAKKGYLDELKDFVNSNNDDNNNLNKYITFIPHKTKKELLEFYRKADVFIYPSVYESFGQPLLEAAASGLPILCSRVGVANDLFKYADTDKILIDNNPKKIAEKIKGMFNVNIRKEISEKNLEVVKKEFNWKKIIDKYVELYTNLV